MKQKEKAFELVAKFSPILPFYSVMDNLNKSKQCAIIAVDELIESTFSKEWYNNNDIIPADYLLTEYWNEVKNEIKKL